MLGLADGNAAQRAHPGAGAPDHPPLAARLAPGRGRPAAAAAATAAAPAARAVAAGRRRLLRGGRARPRRRPGRGPAAAAARRGRGGRARPGAGPDDRRPAGRARVPALPDPWPDEARDLFVRLLAAGPGLLGSGRPSTRPGPWPLILPEWERVRLLPHASVVHRFTVDRHLVETCIEASTLIRRVARPDVLMVAALLHDIGKGQLTEHCVAGEPIAREIAERIGFDPREVELIGDARALAPAAAGDGHHPRPRRPGHDRAWSRPRCADREELELLAALTEADARATSEKAWTTWRASLVHTPRPPRGGRSRRRAVPTTRTPPRSTLPARIKADPTAVSVVADGARRTGSRVTVVAARPGRPARRRRGHARAPAGRRSGPRGPGPRTGSASRCGTSRETGLDDILLRQRLEAIVDGRLDAGERLRRATAGDARAHGRRTPRGLADSDRHRGARRRPARADPHRVRGARRDRRLGPLGPRRPPSARRRSTSSTSRRTPPARSPRSGPPPPRTPYARPWWTPSARRTRRSRTSGAPISAQVCPRRLPLTTGPDHRHPRNHTRVRHAL